MSSAAPSLVHHGPYSSSMASEETNGERDSFETILVAPEDSETQHTFAGTRTDVAEEGDIDLQSDHSSNNRRSQFRPRPGGKAGATSYQLRQYAEATLGGGSLRKIVKLPEGEDENEWFAVNSTPQIIGIGVINFSDANRSGGLLQSDQSALRSHYRILLASVVSRDEGYR